VIPLLLLSLGLAQETCAQLDPLDRERLSVAWVSPAGQQVFHHSWLTVVPTTELQDWVAGHGNSVTRMLQGLGLRKSFKPPARRWKVTIFEVDADTLCRPMAEGEPGTRVGGHPVCRRNDRGVRGDDGCGYTVDTHAGDRGLDVFRIQWRDAAATGFCVLPADRFLRGD
jgi:hypothetical protein